MRRLIIAVALAAGFGCGTVRSVRPVGEGRTALDLSVGGPLVSVAGATYSPESSRWAFTFELRWYAPTTDVMPLAVEWHGVGPYGALAPHLGVSRSFGGDP